MRCRPGVLGPLSHQLGVAALTALAMLIVLPFSMAPAVAAVSGPTVFWGARTGPRDVTIFNFTTVAKLALPKGRFFVTAKAVLVGKGASSYADRSFGAACNLIVGSAVDSMSASPASNGGAGSRVPVLLTVAARLSAPGKAKLRCLALGQKKKGNVRIRDIRITAIRAGRLTTVGTVSPGKTSGSGSPRIISVRSEATTSMCCDVYQEAGQLILPAGRWWIIAKASAFNGGPAFESCRLSAGGDFDDLRFPLAPSGPGTSLPLALQVVHEFSAFGTVRLRCKGSNFQVGHVTITAIRAGRLTNRDLDSGTSSGDGSGKPRIISGWSDGPRYIPVRSKFKTIRKLDLPKGRWTVLAKLWFDSDGAPTDNVSRQTICRLAFGADRDPSQVQYANNLYGVAPMVFSDVHRSTKGQPVKLQCRRTAAGGTGTVAFIKITALKAGSLVQRHL